MACACKGSQNVEYLVLYKGGEAPETVSTLQEVRTKLSASSRGGNYRAVPKQK